MYREYMVDKDAAAEALITVHFEVEPGLRSVYRILSEREAEPDEPIKLLEVNENTIETGRVEPFGFAATSDSSYACVIAEVSPDELEQLQRKLIPMPSNWSLERSKLYPRPQAAE
jgi:hypothetical protein